MIKQKLRKWLGIDTAVETPTAKEEAISVFSTDAKYRTNGNNRATVIGEAYERTFKFPEYVDDAGKNVAMDSGTSLVTAVGSKQQFIDRCGIPEAQILWYASQSFIGYQLCAMLVQHWLISKACSMPAEDAVRKWFQITINDGTKVDPKVIDALKKADVRYKLKSNLIDFVQKGRTFGIRVALFKVRTDDPDLYYSSPFNIDAVKPGSYEGISQIDPYWCTPVPDASTTSDPVDIYFYEPTWWQIQGRRYHRSHLVIFRTEELPDALKPTYSYGGVSIPQKIYERVYAAERTANEAPMLALTKRTTVMKTDLTAAQADPVKFVLKQQDWINNWNNYGIKNLGLDDELDQHDTSLNDLDAVIMTQYQLVAAIANVPSVKLLGTSPKGFNTTGEFEEANYHEALESLQSTHLTAFVDRHHELVIKSEFSNQDPFSTSIVWNSLDAMTAQELATLNKMKADTGVALSGIGAIDGQDERNRIISDIDSGYNGLETAAPDVDDGDGDSTGSDDEENGNSDDPNSNETP